MPRHSIISTGRVYPDQLHFQSWILKKAWSDITQDYTLHDPSLTDSGAEQCRGPLRNSLKARLEGETDIAIISSPMRRTIQTTLLCLDFLIDKGARVEADPDWQGAYLYFRVT